MEVIIYHNGLCTKSRGALEILQEKNIPHTIRYYLAEPLNQKEIKALLKKLGIKAFDLVRKSEELYQSEYKDKNLAEREWVKILAENPILIERPVVEKGDKAVIARPAERMFEVI
jgi:arsenate reductase (glutaredoxin)